MNPQILWMIAFTFGYRLTEDITYLSHKTWENEAIFDVEASSLLASFHSHGKCGTHFKKRKIIISLAYL